ncbi:MAG: halocarboxylic acid dehydrogenase DehI family protein, partial [Burkholderiales bacterium]
MSELAMRKFPQVEHEDATGALKDTFDDIEATLRVPWVAFACRVMSTFPGFLPQAFRIAKPHHSTRYAERAADSLRRNAVMPKAGLRDPRPRLRALGWTEERIRELILVLDAFNYGNPKYLLLITGWSEAIQGRHPSGKPLAPEDAASIPRGRPKEVPSMHHMVDENTASAEVFALYQRIKDMHCHHGPSSDYRLLANYPDYLAQALDDAIAPVARTAEYDARQRDLIVEARDWVRTLPGPVGVGPEDLLATCSPRDLAGLTGLLFMYQRFIADITIDIIRLKQAFDGDAAAGASPFPTA